MELSVIMDILWDRVKRTFQRSIQCQLMDDRLGLLDQSTILLGPEFL